METVELRRSPTKVPAEALVDPAAAWSAVDNDAAP
jgi:hypothetical protein